MAVGDLDIPGTSITVEATFVRTAPYSNGYNWAGDIVSKHNHPTDANYLLRPNNAEITTTNGYFTTPAICEIELNKRYHVAMTYDGATLKFYRNGYLMSSVPATGTLFQNDYETRIGLYDEIVNNTQLIGYVNDVRIWNVVRTQQQIRANMNTPLPSPTTQAGLLANYQFDNLLNKQGNAAWNGTLGGAAAVNVGNPLCSFVTDSCSIVETCDEWLELPTLGSKVLIGDLDVSGDKITVEANFRRTQPLNNGLYYGSLVSKHTSFNDANFSLLPNGCEITTVGSGYKAIFQDCPLELNKNYHVAMVYDGTTLKYYRNGFLLSQIPCTGNIVTNNLTATIGQIAASGDPDYAQFLGQISEVRIWNVARTQIQLREFMTQPLPSPNTQPGLLAYYRFDNLQNKQGNATFNGTAVSSAQPSYTNVECGLIADSCQRITDQEIIVNKYTEVDGFDGCDNILTVANASEFHAGDTVLLIQMKGVEVNLDNAASFGSVLNYQNAGNYEFNYVKSVMGNQIELLNVLTRAYDLPNGKVQLVRVPYYDNYNSFAKMTCLAWDGSKGGILAFNVGGTLTLNHPLDVSGKGFSGGGAVNTRQTVLNCSNNDFSYPAGSILAADKGESIVDLPVANAYGKGASAAGGGGGNDHNSGGGGGGNGGAGGYGGYQYEPCENGIFDNRGIGGNPLAYDNVNRKIFLGSGGGAGHSNNAENAANLSNGGNGGGIILISAQTIVNNQGSILANGADAPQYAPSPSSHAHEAMGGGGAGGTILLQIDNYTQPTSVLVAGGAGANMTADALLYGRIGPGGGGGGGVVWHSGAALNPQVTVDASGGANGVLLQDANNPWGATVGEPGIVLPGLVLPVTSTPFKPNIDSVRVRQILASCSKVDFEGLGYTNTSAISTWHWSFGDGNNSPLQNPSHEYGTEGVFQVKLVVTDINGCKDSITSQVTIGRPDYDFSYETDVCDPLVVTFTGLGITSSPYWSFGDGQTSTASAALVHTYGANGTYLVRYSVNAGNCTDTIEKSITVGATWENIVLTNDTTICAGATKQLLTKSSLDFCWFPTTYLNDPLSATPFTSTPVPMTYYYTAKTVGNNLIINGDFAQGNTSFTSDYIATTFNNTEGQYNIGTNAAAWNGGMSSCSDHTPDNNGNMMHVNGSPVANAKVWTQTVTVQPNTSYAFSTWIASLSASNPARLQFSINGNNLGGPILATIPTCSWNQFYTTWNSGNSTSAVISIVNTNTIQAGNDFALDDISFAPVFTRIDSVRINVETVSVKANNDTTICALEPVQMMASGAASYSWSPAAGLNDVTIANPVASPAVSTQYILTGTSANGCVDKDTVNVNIFQKPAMSLTDDTEICPASSITLEATGGTSYQWTPAATLSSATIGNPVATPQQNTEYFVTITDANECRYLDSVTIAIRPPAQFAINPPIGICANDKVLLTASGGNIYQWTAAPGITQLNVASPEVSPPVTTEYIVNITENVCNTSAELRTLVTVRPLPDIIASRSVDLDCSTDRSQLTARGGQTYIWNADPSLSNPAISNPVATPRVTTQYVVWGTDAAGCSNTDTVTVKVDRANEGSYLMPTAFTPNNDGLNDCYGINLWGVVENVEFSIFNRWGERVFYSRDPRACWDGTYKGKPQDSAVFVYMVKASTMCEPSVFRKGTFVLIR